MVKGGAVSTTNSSIGYDGSPLTDNTLWLPCITLSVAPPNTESARTASTADIAFLFRKKHIHIYHYYTKIFVSINALSALISFIPVKPPVPCVDFKRGKIIRRKSARFGSWRKFYFIAGNRGKRHHNGYWNFHYILLGNVNNSAFDDGFKLNRPLHLKTSFAL
ncbi:MAG: hypothetical protein LBU26_02330 [Synergistaceae bacterium]|jgi:hypothetical protein|nr:hypothetical protein [Synergistaceae bacterium]